MEANWLSNGLGGQSMFLLKLAAEREIPATVSITADTGSENDRVCSTGERMSAPSFFHRYVKPYAEAHGIEAVFVRSLDKDKMPLPSIIDILRRGGSGPQFEDMIRGVSVPLFTNDKSRGRLRQSCTDKWKIRAVNQEAKRRGISLLRSAIGFHAGEAHRIKAKYLRQDGPWDVWKPQTNRDGKMRDIRWLEHYYPIVDMGLNREGVRKELEKAGLPYLVTTECDMCPHQDLARWNMHTPEVIQEAADLEAKWQGKLFFTALRIPLKEALSVMRQKELGKQDELPGFGCENGAYCGI